MVQLYKLAHLFILIYMHVCVCAVQRESSRVSLKRSSEIKARADVQRSSVMESVDPALGGIKQQLQGKSEFTPLQSTRPFTRM